MVTCYCCCDNAPCASLCNYRLVTSHHQPGLLPACRRGSSPCGGPAGRWRCTCDESVCPTTGRGRAEAHVDGGVLRGLVHVCRHRGRVSRGRCLDGPLQWVREKEGTLLGVAIRRDPFNAGGMLADLLPALQGVRWDEAQYRKQRSSFVVGTRCRWQPYQLGGNVPGFGSGRFQEVPILLVPEPSQGRSFPILDQSLRRHCIAIATR